MRAHSGFAIPAILLTMAGPAAAASCTSLYVDRNSIYKDQGYCFKTERAITMFGNAGCQFDDVDDVPLSASQRRAVAEIKRLEQDLGCR